MSTGYVIGSDGKIVPPGQTKFVYEANLINGEALPSWLTASSGTASATAMSASAKGYGLVTPASAAVGQKAQLNTMNIPTTYYSGIMFEALGITFDNQATQNLTCDCVIGIANNGGTSAGARVNQTSTQDQAAFTIAGQSGTFGNVPYSFRTLYEPSRPKNIGLLLLPLTQELIFFEGAPEQSIARLQNVNIAGGLVSGHVGMTLQEAVSHVIRIQGARVTLWSA